MLTPWLAPKIFLSKWQSVLVADARSAVATPFGGGCQLNDTFSLSRLYSQISLHRMASRYYEEEEKVQETCRAWGSGQFPSISAAARSVGADVQRVRRRLAGKESRSTRAPTNRLLTDDEETALVKWLEALDTLGTRSSLKMLSREVNWLISQRKAAPNNPPTHPIRCGAHFAPRFLKRHPHLALRPEMPRDINRGCAEDVEGLERWYSLWNEVVTQNHLQPSDIWNYDESPVRLGQGRSQKKITRAKNKRVQAGKNTSRESCSIAECVNVNGTYFGGALIIFAGERFMESWADAPLPGHYFIDTTPNGFITDETFYD